MNDNPFVKKISSKQKTFLIIVSLFILGIVISQLISTVGIHFIKQTAEEQNIDIKPLAEQRLIFGYRLLMTIFCIEVVLLLCLLWIYFQIYRKTQSSFILGLNFFIGILLLKSSLSIVYLFTFFNESIKNLPTALNVLGTSGFGVLGFFINIFEIIAIGILLYLALE